MDDTKRFYSDSNVFNKSTLIVAVIGIVTSIVAFFVDSPQFYHSYLTAYMYWLTIVLGGLFFTMLHHISGAVWSTVLRRLSESIMISIPVMAILFLPVIIGMHDLYHWTHADAVAQDELLQKKEAYLNAVFFTIRAIVYFSIWFLLAWSLYKTSLKQDAGHDEKYTKKFKKISAPGIVVFALTITFASFDWLMSLDPHWYSTIYGLYVFAGSFLSFMAFIVIVGLALRKKGYLTDAFTVEHYHDIGKFLFGFIVFWGYMAFSQYFLIWYANIPEETIWYIHRWEGNWSFLTMVLVFGHFLLPFMVLMLRSVKRNFFTLKIIAYWILLMHFIDLYWLVFPTFSKHGFVFSWVDVATFLAVGGIFLWYFWYKYFGAAMVAINDPKLKKSMELVN